MTLTLKSPGYYLSGAQSAFQRELIDKCLWLSRTSNANAIDVPLQALSEVLSAAAYAGVLPEDSTLNEEEIRQLMPLIRAAKQLNMKAAIIDILVDVLTEKQVPGAFLEGVHTAFEKADKGKTAR